MVHAFTRYKGVSPISYLINRRIDEAKELLTHSNLPIAKIAQSVGFSSQSYFSQVFRKEVHMTPWAYRKATFLRPYWFLQNKISLLIVV